MIKYAWKILNIEKSNTEHIEDVINTIHWEYQATDGKHLVSEYGSTILNPPNSSESFLPYKLLSKESIVYWLESILDVNSLQSLLNSRISKLQK